MLKSEYDELTNYEQVEPMITIDDLDSTEDRLLLYGFTPERETFAVAVRHGRISRTIFHWNATPVWIAADQWHVTQLYPMKRVYPEDTSADFIRLLRSKGGTPDLTRWDDERAARLAAGTHVYAWE